MKICTGCGETKALSAFGKNKRGKDGIHPRCRVCISVAAKEARARLNADPERVARRRERDRAYYAANPGAAAARTQKWRENNPEEYRASYKRANRIAQESGYNKAWYWKNADKARARARLDMAKNRREHPEAQKERQKRYRSNNIEVVRSREREKTYSRRAKMPYSKTTAEYMKHLATQPCAYCGSEDNITIDHIEPLSRGGKHEPANLAAACWTCNCSKGAKPLDEWLGTRRAV